MLVLQRNSNGKILIIMTSIVALREVKFATYKANGKETRMITYMDLLATKTEIISKLKNLENSENVNKDAKEIKLFVDKYAEIIKNYDETEEDIPFKEGEY